MHKLHISFPSRLGNINSMKKLMQTIEVGVVSIPVVVIHYTREHKKFVAVPNPHEATCTTLQSQGWWERSGSSPTCLHVKLQIESILSCKKKKCFFLLFPQSTIRQQQTSWYISPPQGYSLHLLQLSASTFSWSLYT